MFESSASFRTIEPELVPSPVIVTLSSNWPVDVNVAVVPATVVPVIAAGVVPPMTVPSIVPPLMSAVVWIEDANV